MPVIFSESAAFSSSCATALDFFIIIVLVVVIIVIVILWLLFLSSLSPTHSISSRSSFSEKRSCCMYSDIELKYLKIHFKYLKIPDNTFQIPECTFQISDNCENLWKRTMLLWMLTSWFVYFLLVYLFVCCLFVCLCFEFNLIALPMSLEPLFRSIAFSRIWRSLIL